MAKSSSSLDTLIEDIYKPLEGLAKGQSLSLKEEDLDKTLENIKQSILSWANPPTGEDSSFRLRMSNIGRPARKLWYESRDTDEGHIDAPTQIRFLYGHILEEIILMLVRLAGRKVTDQQKEVTVEGITGHIDCKIDNEIVDIKTASKFSFSKFVNKTLVDYDAFGYLSQLAGYEAAEGTNDGGFLVINKESGDLCFYRPEDLEKPNIKHKIQYLKNVLELNEPPELCYNPVAEGKKGNMKLNKGCVYCKYKFDCYKDSNDGQGLRVFKYASGPVYFTEVLSEPSVEEIT
tara:strand:+ start:79 stop:948 length:870 start_codon:yes stop_codon:yes gene_type:complete